MSGGFNIYSYANNNPLTYFDPYGLYCLTADQIAVIAAASGGAAGGALYGGGIQGAIIGGTLAGTAEYGAQKFNDQEKLSGGSIAIGGIAGLAGGGKSGAIAGMTGAALAGGISDSGQDFSSTISGTAGGLVGAVYGEFSGGFGDRKNANPVKAMSFFKAIRSGLVGGLAEDITRKLLTENLMCKENSDCN